LKGDNALLADVRLGDVDGDGRCDVVKDAGQGNWMIASGATADWKSLGNYLAPLNQVRFGRFDPAAPDHNPGIRPPTHAFWRSDDGFWFVTPLSQPNGWTVAASSSFPLSDLRFGDFTGDGVTDVLANEQNRWTFSDAGRATWSRLNTTLNDPVKNPNIYIANMDVDVGDNIDDILRLDTSGRGQVVVSGVSLEITWPSGGLATGIKGDETLTATWQRSKNGRTGWDQFKSYSYTVNGTIVEDYVGLGTAFVGHFRGGFGATILTIDPNRMGHFFSLGQSGQTEWLSLFWY
jgi:hypothetical protein